MGYLDWKCKKEKGAALPLAIVIMATMFIFGAALLNLTDTETLSAYKSGDRLRAQYVAEAGIEKALVELHRDQDWSPAPSYDLEGGTVEITKQEVSNENERYIKITARGEFGGERYEITRRLEPLALFTNESLRLGIDWGGTGDVTIAGNLHGNNAIRVFQVYGKPAFSQGRVTYSNVAPSLDGGASAVPWPAKLPVPQFDFEGAKEKAIEEGRFFDRDITLDIQGSSFRVLASDDPKKPALLTLDLNQNPGGLYYTTGNITVTEDFISGLLGMLLNVVNFTVGDLLGVLNDVLGGVLGLVELLIRLLLGPLFALLDIDLEILLNLLGIFAGLGINLNDEVLNNLDQLLENLLVVVPNHYTLIAEGDITYLGGIGNLLPIFPLNLNMIAKNNVTVAGPANIDGVVFAQGIETGRDSAGHRIYEGDTGVVKNNIVKEGLGALRFRIKGFLGGQRITMVNGGVEDISVLYEPVSSKLPEGISFKSGLFRIRPEE